MAINNTQDVDIYNKDNVQSDQDDAAIQKLLSQTTKGVGNTSLLDLNRPLNFSKKANDAKNYRDLSDDNLLEEEAASQRTTDGPRLTDDRGRED